MEVFCWNIGSVVPKNIKVHRIWNLRPDTLPCQHTQSFRGASDTAIRKRTKIYQHYPFCSCAAGVSTIYLFIILHQRKFTNLTSDYTENCRQVLKHRCLTAEMFHNTGAGREGVWRVGIARNALFFQSFVASKARKVSFQKRELRRIGSAKFAPRCGARAIWKPKSLKHRGFGAFFKVELRKICAMLWQESDLEAKVVKNWQGRGTFGSWAPQNLHHAVARERFKANIVKIWRSGPFWKLKLRFAWQAQEFVRAKNVGKCGGFEEAPKRCCSRGRRKDFVLCDVDVWRLGRWMRGKVANFMSRKCYFAGIISRGSCRSSYGSVNFLMALAVLLKHPLKKSPKRIAILRSSQVSGQRVIFEGSLAKKASFLSFKASFFGCQIHYRISHQLNLKLNDLPMNWISKRMTFKPIESRSNWMWNHLNLISTVKRTSLDSQVTCLDLKLIEYQINWQQNHLNLKAIERRITWTWISNPLTFKAVESQLNWQQRTWNLKPMESQSSWISNHLNLKSIESPTKCKTIESEINWLSSQFNSTPSSYRFLIFGNFRHRLVR